MGIVLDEVGQVHGQGGSLAAGNAGAEAGDPQLFLLGCLRDGRRSGGVRRKGRHDVIEVSVEDDTKRKLEVPVAVLNLL